MILDEKQFIIGFNSGYLLAIYESKMLTALLKEIHPTNSFMWGLSLGQKQYELEQERQQLDQLNQTRTKGRIPKERDLE